ITSRIRHTRWPRDWSSDVCSSDLLQTQRCVASVLRFAGNSDIEIILVDNALQDELSIWAAALQHSDARVHVLRVSRTMGEAEAHNIGLKQSQGRYILLLDSSIELTGDV